MTSNISITKEMDDGHPLRKITAVQVDVTEPSGPVTVEIDRKRRVLYVHMEGYTVLRICRAEKYVIEDSK